MDNTDFNYIDIMNELEMISDGMLVELFDDEDIDFERDHDCDGCWFKLESCGKVKE
jgi:hypothetical protein